MSLPSSVFCSNCGWGYMRNHPEDSNWLKCSVCGNSVKGTASRLFDQLIEKKPESSLATKVIPEINSSSKSPSWV